jgi:hypothetical protein
MLFVQFEYYSRLKVFQQQALMGQRLVSLVRFLALREYYFFVENYFLAELGPGGFAGPEAQPPEEVVAVLFCPE